MALEAKYNPDNSLLRLEGIYIISVLFQDEKYFFILTIFRKHEDMKTINVFYPTRHEKYLSQR